LKNYQLGNLESVDSRGFAVSGWEWSWYFSKILSVRIWWNHQWNCSEKQL